MKTKSIKLPRLCIIVTFLGYFVISNLVKTVIAHSQQSRNEKVRDILNDLPLKLDLDKYVYKLGKIIDFVDSNRYYVDTTFAFNLFLVKINLEAILEVKENELGDESISNLRQILQKNDNCIEYFWNMYRNYVEKLDPGAPVTRIPELFSNEAIWTKHLQRFKNRLLVKTQLYPPEDLNSFFPAFDDYVKTVLHFKHYFIDPKLLDKCINQLANISVNEANKLIKCEIDISCQAEALKFSNSGYEILYRLLFFMMARHARGCIVVTAALDKQVMDALCAKIYNEAEFLAYNKFELPHLSMAQINLCSLEGHVQFLRRTWIDDLLKLLTEFGCMKQKKKSLMLHTMDSPSENQNWQLIHNTGVLYAGLCSSSATGSAAVMLAAAIRYILEKFY